MIRWLHISDLHFNNDDMSTDSMREELPKYLKKNNIRCDYVFCTGDIRTANAESNHFPDEAARFLIDLCTAVGTSTDRLFIVPGNHDVDRDATGRDEVIRKICFQRNGYYDPKYGKIEEDDLKVVYSGQEEFREFLSKIYTADRMAKYANPLNPHFNVETENFNILHIDSTLTYTKDQESVDLVIGTKLLQNALKELNPDKPTVLLSHYPFTSLLQEEKKYVRELLYRKGVCLIGIPENSHSLLWSILEICQEDIGLVLPSVYTRRGKTERMPSFLWKICWIVFPILKREAVLIIQGLICGACKFQMLRK